jgi:chromosome segregation ATPase
MAAMGVYDQIKSAFQDIIAPELHHIRGDIRVLDQKLVGLDQKIDGLDARLTSKLDSLKAELISEIRRVDTRIDGVHTRIDGVDTRIDGLDRDIRTAIDVRERLAALEARRPA